MSNLVEIAKDLEYVPDEQLVQLANGSDPRFPPFVVISEIKRRTDMRNRASEPMPKTTVAQEMVQEFAMPSRQGLEGMSQDATGILPPTVYNRDMPSSMMADGGLVGYATGDETKYRENINRLLGAKLGPTNPKTLDESMSRLERYRKSQQIGRLINDPNHPLNKFFRYIPDGQQMSNYLLGRRGEDFTPDVRRPTDKPMDKKQEGGLTGYQTGNQTALAGSFIYGGNYADNLEDFLDMKRKTSTMDQREQSYLGQKNQAYPMLSTTPDFDMDMSGISALTPTQTDLDSTLVMQNTEDRPSFLTDTGTSDFISESKTLNYLEKQLAEAKENLRKQKARGDRGVLGGGTSYIEQAQARVDRLQKQIDPRVNRKNFVVDTQNLLKESEGERREDLAKAIKVQEDKEKADAEEAARLAAEEAEKKKFANMDVDIPERTQRPRTEAEMKQQLNADVLMTLGTAIGGSATPSEIFQKLSGLPAQLAASRKEQRKEVRDFESDRRADALQKLNIQIALKKIDQAEEKARLKGDANDIAAINAIADVLTGTLDTNSQRYKSAERALDSIIAKLSGNETNKGIAALSELLIPAES